MGPLRVSGINVYPVKACAGFSPRSARISIRGLAGDRDFMVVDGAGRFITQREHARLALVHPEVAADRIRLTSAGGGGIEIPIAYTGTARDVSIWRDRCRAIDQGDEAALWFTALLGVECRLVRVDETFTRKVNPLYAEHTTDQVGYADGFPLLLVSDQSLADLNARMDAAVPMGRFRPNLVISGGEPFVEDTLRRFRIRGITFDVVKPSARCVVTTIDQRTGLRDGREPLRTLAAYRRRATGGGVLFGQNVVHAGEGEIAVGDALEVLATQPALFGTTG